MPYRYRVERERALVILEFWGVAGNEDLYNSDDALRADSEVKPEFDQLIDLSRVELLEMTGEAIVEVATREPFFSVEVRRAIVATEPESFGMARVFEMRRDGAAGHIRVFREAKAAVAWLVAGAEDV